MKMAKATNSVDGVKRMTLSVKFRAGKFELATAMGDYLETDFNLSFAEDPENRKKEILEEVA